MHIINILNIIINISINIIINVTSLILHIYNVIKVKQVISNYK